MPETYDITLAGASYMLAPGSYRRQQAGPVPPATTRRVTHALWRDARQALPTQPGRYWTAHGLRPTLDGQGLTAGYKEAAPVPVTGLDTTNPRYAVIAGGRPYFVAGDGLWRVDRASGAFPTNLGGATQLGGSLGAIASGLAMSDEIGLWVARSGSGLWLWNLSTSAWTTYTFPFNGIAIYAERLWGLGLATTSNALQLVLDLATSTTKQWNLDAPLRAAALVRDGLYVATTRSLWRVNGSISGSGTGTTWTGTVAPLVYASGAGFGDSFTHLTDYGGELFTWYAGQVHRYDASATVGGALVPTGLRAAECRGLAVAGAFLIAAVTDTPQYPGIAQLWAFDGHGWFCLARNPGGLDYAYPFPSAHYTVNADVIVSTLGLAQLSGFQFQSFTDQRGYQASGELLSGLLHDDRPDELKTWLRVGAQLVTPGRASSPGIPDFTACTVELAYTLDGTNYTTAGSLVIDTSRATTLAFDLPAGTLAPALGLAWRLSGVTTGAPTLVSLWAEYRPVERATPRRAWSFEILASDETTTRAGGQDPRSGRAIAAALWSAWSTGGPLTFRDIDYDLDPTTRTVRLTHLDEQTKTTSDAGRWTEARIRVTLVED